MNTNKNNIYPNKDCNLCPRLFLYRKNNIDNVVISVRHGKKPYHKLITFTVIESVFLHPLTSVNSNTYIVVSKGLAKGL